VRWRGLNFTLCLLKLLRKFKCNWNLVSCEDMKQEEEKGMKGEEMEKLLVEVVEPTVKRVYGMGIKDIFDRIGTINRELGEISKTISMLVTRIDGMDKTMSVLTTRIDGMNKRIDDLWKVVVAILGGTFGTLIGIILMLIKLLI